MIASLSGSIINYVIQDFKLIFEYFKPRNKSIFEILSSNSESAYEGENQTSEREITIRKLKRLLCINGIVKFRKPTSWRFRFDRFFLETKNLLHQRNMY